MQQQTIGIDLEEDIKEAVGTAAFSKRIQVQDAVNELLLFFDLTEGGTGCVVQ